MSRTPFRFRPLLAVAATVVAAVSVAGCTHDERRPRTEVFEESGKVLPRQDIVMVRDDLVRGKLVFYGPALLRPDFPEVARGGYRLRSEMDKASGAVTHWVDLRWHWTGSGIDYWVAAQEERTVTNESGAERQERIIPVPLGVAQMDVGVCSPFIWIGCDHDDEISAQVTEDMLRTAPEEGLRVRFRMQHGRDYVARMPLTHVKAQLVTIDGWRPQPPRN
ncbi:hypothetical protein [Magnetospirillum sp. UT-4]|uniref:hypothetical protein n=1 Tax=Magnetospirillum sp. UT-4 TaxID=2681467 RepID=UPI00138010C2|nr:hypothetical protein [Magnetospirillum sp. UT-4]CAA7612943.1 exported hypothetical protein [Magnetospirillum sp. UT-4]